MLKRAGKNVALFLFAAALTLALLELFFRSFMPVSTVSRFIHPRVGAMLIPDQESRYVSREFDNTVRTNSLGFHDFEHQVAKNPGVLRIVVLGDSFVEALQQPREKLFTTLLAQKLSRGLEREVEVVNMGVGATGTAQQLEVYSNFARRFKPDVVLLCFYAENDFANNNMKFIGQSELQPFYRLEEGRLELIPPAYQKKESYVKLLLKQSALCRYFVDRLRTSDFLHRIMVALDVVKDTRTNPQVEKAEDRLGYPMQYKFQRKTYDRDCRRSLAITEALLGEFERRVSRDGGVFWVAILPDHFNVQIRDPAHYFEAYPEMADESWDFSRPYREAEKMLTEQDIAYINLLPGFVREYDRTGDLLHYPHDTHWTPRGHELAAGMISEFMEKRLQGRRGGGG